ncbi:MAG: paraslipin [Deltaproteobacteria bacterium]|jgi:regulator of protease activity HflC (stomatin/prohibitin superfamily)|nr:paraslipin [Deltaproteobacteria bacterium]
MSSVFIVVLIGWAIFLIFLFVNYVRIVPQNQAFVVERLGKFSSTLISGFHLLIPFIDKVAYKHTLKEQVIDVPPQICITRDNISVEVDGVLYMTVMDPRLASYGVSDYHSAAIQMSQTTMRSVIGKLELDRTFEERESINADIINAVDKASSPWGVKVNRYEVKNITPPQSIKDAMEKQMRAEREKRALIAESEGEKQAKINIAEGEKLAKINIAEGERQKLINVSEGERQRRINEAAGRAQEITLVAEATAEALKLVGLAISSEGGTDAVSLRIAENYLNEFGKLAKANNSMIIPSNVIDIASIVAVGKEVIKSGRPTGAPEDADPVAAPAPGKKGPPNK